MSNTKPFLCLVLLALGASFASAQQLPLDPVLVPPDNSYRYAAKRLDAAPEDHFTRAVTGRFNDDTQPDVFIRRRSSAHMFVNPTIWDAALAVPSVLRGMARLTGTASTGRDELLAATTEGLRAWTRDSASGAFVSRAIGDDLLWDHVEYLIAADLDSQFGDDIVGIAPGGGQALVLMAQAGGTFAPEFVFALPSPPLGVVACDFGGIGSKQLVFLDPTHVRVYGYDGVLRLTLAVSGSKVATVLRKGTSLRQRVAWIADDGAGDVLRLLDAQLAGEVALGDIDAVGIARWNFDGDGDDDLVISHRAGWDLRLLTNVGSAFHTVPQKVLETGPAGPAPSNSAWPAVADLDGDGDEDVFIPVQADEMIFVHLGEPIEHRDLLPGFEMPVLYNHGSYLGGPIRGYLQLSVLPADAPPQDATHIDLVLWRKAALAAATEPEPEAGFSFRWDVNAPDFDTNLIEYDEPDESIVFWAQRYVQVDPTSGEVVRVFPAAVHGVTADNYFHGGPVIDYLLARGADFNSSTTPDDLTGFNHVRTTSTIIDLIPIIDFEEDVEPDPDP